MQQLTFITGNPGKAEKLRKYLGENLLHKSVDLPEIQSLDLRKIVEQKTREAYKHVNGPVLVEDVSLRFGAIRNLPGPLIKWFLEDLGNDGLCKMADVYDDRSAVAKVCFGYYDGGEVHFFEHEVHGTIADHPRGEKPFGWDVIFIPEGCQKTWAEMTEEEASVVSLRRPALAKLEEFLHARP